MGNEKMCRRFGGQTTSNGCLSSHSQQLSSQRLQAIEHAINSLSLLSAAGGVGGPAKLQRGEIVRLVPLCSRTATGCFGIVSHKQKAKDRQCPGRPVDVSVRELESLPTCVPLQPELRTQYSVHTPYCFPKEQLPARECLCLFRPFGDAPAAYRQDL